MDQKEIPEFYSDNFEIIGGTFGVVFNFRRGPREPNIQGFETLARVNMSWEHAKALTYINWRNIKKIEEHAGVSYPMPNKALSDMGIAREDWDEFWKATPFTFGGA